MWRESVETREVRGGSMSCGERAWKTFRLSPISRFPDFPISRFPKVMRLSRRPPNMYGSKVAQWLMRGAGFGGGLLCLPALATGSAIVLQWIHLKTQFVMYFDYNYFPVGVLWLSCALIGISASVLAVTHRVRYGRAALVAVGIGLISAISVPNGGPRAQMITSMTSLLGHADHSLALWDDAHGRFPGSDAELLDALKQRPLGEKPVFAEGTRGLPYAVRLVPDANGPYAALVPNSPGVFVYAIRRDLHEYWLTVTTLDRPVAGRIVFHRVGGDFQNGKLWVINRTHRQDGQLQRGFVE